MTDAQRTEPAPRASDQDRDALLVRLHTAYAEGRLDERELDERIELVLASRTHEELDRLAADLPAPGTDPRWRPEADARRRSGGSFQMAYKNRVSRAGRWRLPQRYTVAVYKGECLLDLTEAELAGPVVTLRVLAYKSDVRIVVPPGVRVEAAGLGVSTGVWAEPDPLAPVVHVQGLAYKGGIEAIDQLRHA